MKTVIIAIVILLAGTATFAQAKKSSKQKSTHSKMAYTCDMHPDVVTNKPGKCPECGMKLTPVKGSVANTKYQCPMKCEGDKTYATAGKCSVCGMQMTAVKTDSANATYMCPMKCEGEKTYASAGKCPVCKMDLTKVDTKKDKTGHEGHNHD